MKKKPSYNTSHRLGNGFVLQEMNKNLEYINLLFIYNTL